MKPVFKGNLYALIIVVGQVLGGIFLVPILKTMNINLPGLLVLTQLIFLILPSIIYFLITREPIKETLRFNRISFKEIIFIIFITILCLPIAGFLGSITTIFFKNNVEEVFNSMQSLSYPAMLLVMAVTPAICEEITMRGIVLSNYDDKGIFKAALMNGILFGILHLNPVQLLYTIALGMLFAYLVRVTNSIFSSMLAHFVFNGTQVTLSRLVYKLGDIAKEQDKLESLSINQRLMALIPVLVAAIIATVIIIMLIKKLSKGRQTENNGMFYTSPVYTGGDYAEERGYYSTSRFKKDYVFNIPFVLTVAFYLFYVKALFL